MHIPGTRDWALTVNPMPTVAEKEPGMNLPWSNWTSRDVFPTPLSPTRIVCKDQIKRHQCRCRCRGSWGPDIWISVLGGCGSKCRTHPAPGLSLLVLPLAQRGISTPLSIFVIKEMCYGMSFRPETHCTLSRKGEMGGKAKHSLSWRVSRRDASTPAREASRQKQPWLT